MPADVETMMYVGEPPWHGFGTYVGDQDVDSKEAIIAAGLDWDVQTKELYCTGDGVNFQEVKQSKAVQRKSDGVVLGVVGNRYHPVQNKEAFEFMDALVDDGMMKYHTAGSLGGGRRIWLLGKIGSSEVVPGDKVDQYLLLHNTHDGSSSLRCLFTAVRVVCSNTAQVALMKGKKEGLRLRHTKGITENLDQAREVLGIAVNKFHSFDKFARSAAATDIDAAMWDKFIKSLIPDPPAPMKNTRAKNTREIVTELYHDGIGQDIPGVAGTGWAAYNAVVEFANYHRTARGNQKQQRRFESSLFGGSAQLIQRAMDRIDQIAA